MGEVREGQRGVLGGMSQFTENNDYPPTVREISDNFKISLRAVQDHITKKKKKGYLTQCQKRARSIRVLTDCREK